PSGTTHSVPQQRAGTYNPAVDPWNYDASRPVGRHDARVSSHAETTCRGIESSTKRMAPSVFRPLEPGVPRTRAIVAGQIEDVTNPKSLFELYVDGYIVGLELMLLGSRRWGTFSVAEGKAEKDLVKLMKQLSRQPLWRVWVKRDLEILQNKERAKYAATDVRIQQKAREMLLKTAALRSWLEKLA
ncbi:MAG: hypothetical protein ACD_62C00229G0001, partial [uncultured bacterium]